MQYKLLTFSLFLSIGKEGIREYLRTSYYLSIGITGTNAYIF